VIAALGDKPPTSLLDDLTTKRKEFSTLFPPISEWSALEDDEEQDYAEFSSMERYKL
jgi:hypothetical protein